MKASTLLAASASVLCALPIGVGGNGGSGIVIIRCRHIAMGMSLRIR